MTKKLVAYDYEAQRWVEGETARALLVAQAEETLAVLDGPEGERYVAATRRRGEPAVTVAQARAAVVAELESLR